ncbi:MAG: hypothetical protein RLZZ187_771 [Pseudomonadota bacterium]|jgi:hypothetical protein
MSDIDRVFAQLGGKRSSDGDQRELRRIPRKGNAAGTRVVEVVRLPAKGAASPGGASRQTDYRLRAATWDDGFPAKSAPTPSVFAPPPAADALPPVVPPAAPPVVHVMPGWAPSSVEPQIRPAPAADATPRAARTRRTAPAVSRRVADPFDAADDVANCLRCGYVVEPAREHRGLMTCAACG